MNGKTIIGSVALVIGSALAACSCTTVTNQPAPPTPTATRRVTPAPSITTVHPPAAATATSYAQDITNAGIVAPVGWINDTGQRLCADWRSGMTTAETDNILLAGGLHADHLAAFDRITNEDLCPDVTP
jgi:hypothetical protein